MSIQPARKAQRERFFEQLREKAPDWLKELWAASKRRGTDKLTSRQIEGIIAKARKDRRKRKTKQPAAR